MVGPVRAGTETPAIGPLVDAAVARLPDAHHIPGVAIAVARHGQVVYAHGYGVIDTTTMAPVTVDTPFEIGSITKQFTAASVLQLARAGKLSLDDPLALTYRGTSSAGGLRTYISIATFGGGSAKITRALAADGKIAGYLVQGTD